MATINITFNEFRGFVFSDLPYYFSETTVGGERAFDTDMGNGYSLRILTSIPQGQDEVREEGEDAIRVQLVDENGSPVKTASHTKRTPGYRDRVTTKVKELSRCPQCWSELKVAKSEHGPYLFCTSNDCGYTESI
jgi:hypothetical protein